MLFRRFSVLCLAVALAGGAPSPAVAQQVGLVPTEEEVRSTIKEPSYSPYAGRRFPTQVYWGDTHLHTSYSPDASMNGNFRIGPAEAFRFARGEIIEAHNGQSARLKRPLDFLVVADHAETPVTGIVAGADGLGSGVRLGGDAFDQDVALAGRVYCKVVAGPEGIAIVGTESEVIERIGALADIGVTEFAGSEFAADPDEAAATRAALKAAISA